MRRDLALGVGAAASLLWLTFFASAGTVQVATLAVAVAALIWFSTVDPRRLVDERGRPHPLVVGLTALVVALAITAIVFIGTPTAFAISGVIVAAGIVGTVRSVMAAMDET